VVDRRIHPLPAETAYFIGVVLITRLTGRLVQCHWSLARAALPFLLQWGWQRVAQARKRDKFSRDALCERAAT
jgi:hypothetical protein